MSPSNPQDEPNPTPGPGRGWIGPGLITAGVLALSRVEVLTELAVEQRGVAPALARWGVLGHVEAIAVQSLVMGMVAAALLWSLSGKRRYGGFVFAGLLFLSAMAGWPVADEATTAHGGASGIAYLPLLAGLAFGEAAVLAGLALFAERNAAAGRLLETRPVVVVLGLVGVILPGWILWRDTNDAPTMPVREVVAELIGTSPRSAVRIPGVVRKDLPPVLTPYLDWRLTAAEHDTGDKPTLQMPPPAVWSFTVTDPIGEVDLRAAAQIDFEFSHHWPDPEGNDRPSPMDELGVEAISVRFEVLVDGEAVFDEVIVHRREGDTGEDREWRHVGEGGVLPLLPGQVVTLKTSFGDAATEALWTAHPGCFRCGFGDLVLERWHERPRQRAAREQPNVVFIVMDTLRADRMSCYGYPKPTTPNADALARRGVLFESAFATSSWTWPSTASLLTGLLPYEHGVISNAACNLNLSYESVAEVLQDRGYTTAAISCNPLIDPARQFDQGFETFDAGPRMRMTDEVIGQIEHTLDSISDSRFFLYLQLVDPHTPHRPLESEVKRLGGRAPKDFPHEVRLGVEIDGMDHYAQLLNRGEGRDPDGTPHPERVIPEDHVRWLNDRYDASVGTGDHFVGRILGRLEALGLTEKTVVVFTSDHGEELLDHDMLEHGHALWTELVRVPLIIAGPGLPEGVRVTEEISNRHLAPTMAMLGGGSMSQVGDAQNLLAGRIDEIPIFYQTEKGYWNGHTGLQLLGWRDGQYVTHLAPNGGDWKQPPDAGGQVRLFHREDDPLELVDLSIDTQRRDEIAGESVPAVRASLDGQRERKVGIDVPMGAEMRKNLEGVGYVDRGDGSRREDGE